MASPHSNPDPQIDITHSLHDQLWVHPDLRQRHHDIILESLTNTPNHAADPFQPQLVPDIPTVYIEGTFLPFNERRFCEQWLVPEYRRRQLHYLKSIGIDTLIVLTGNRGGVCFHSQTFPQLVEDDLLDRVLGDASALGFSTWIGLPHVEIAWMLQNEDELNRLLEVSRSTIRELHERYSIHAGFYGWYIPYELCNVFVTQAVTEPLLVNWVNEIARFCKSITPAVPVGIAPYFTTVDGIAEFDRIWNLIFAMLIDVDVVMVQDSVGIFKEQRLNELAACFSRLQTIARRFGKRLWADVELFDQQTGIPLNEESWSAVTPSCDRVLRQIRTVAPFVERIVAFSTCDYVNPEASDAARSFYESYQRYYLETASLSSIPR